MNHKDSSNIQLINAKLISSQLNELDHRTSVRSNLLNFFSFDSITFSQTTSFLKFIINVYKSLLFSILTIYYSVRSFIFRTDSNEQSSATSYFKERQFCNYKITDVPEHLRFNKFILNGYRSTLNFKESLLSLFYIHNESTNIYSHGKDFD